MSSMTDVLGLAIVVLFALSAATVLCLIAVLAPSGTVRQRAKDLLLHLVGHQPDTCRDRHPGQSHRHRRHQTGR